MTKISLIKRKSIPASLCPKVSCRHRGRIFSPGADERRRGAFVVDGNDIPMGRTDDPRSLPDWEARQSARSVRLCDGRRQARRLEATRVFNVL